MADRVVLTGEHPTRERLEQRAEALEVRIMSSVNARTAMLRRRGRPAGPRALGHVRATTTLNTYAHLWPTAEERTRRAAGDLLAGVLRILADCVRTNQGS